jgi:hypothetical protein
MSKGLVPWGIVCLLISGLLMTSAHADEATPSIVRNNSISSLDPPTPPVASLFDPGTGHLLGTDILQPYTYSFYSEALQMPGDGPLVVYQVSDTNQTLFLSIGAGGEVQFNSFAGTCRYADSAVLTGFLNSIPILNVEFTHALQLFGPVAFQVAIVCEDAQGVVGLATNPAKVGTEQEVALLYSRDVLQVPRAYITATRSGVFDQFSADGGLRYDLTDPLNPRYDVLDGNGQVVVLPAASKAATSGSTCFDVGVAYHACLVENQAWLAATKALADARFDHGRSLLPCLNLLGGEPTPQDFVKCTAVNSLGFVYLLVGPLSVTDCEATIPAGGASCPLPPGGSPACATASACNLDGGNGAAYCVYSSQDACTSTLQCGGAAFCASGACLPTIQPELCDGYDNNCNGSLDDGENSLCGDGNSCTDDVCNGTGGCAHIANTASCNDGNICTTGDTCSSGTCSGTATTCDDGDPCTVDTCAPGSGCGHTLISGCDSAAGCRDGTREGLVDAISHPNIAGCAGQWTGRIDGPSAQALCGPGWSVCSPAMNPAHRDTVRAVDFSAATDFPGCFPFAAADDDGNCFECTGTQPSDDMAGMGSGCPFQWASGFGSCLGSGRVDADCCFAYTTDHACSQKTSPYTKVTCCRDQASSSSSCLKVNGAGWVEAPDSPSLDVQGDMTIEFWALVDPSASYFPAVTKWHDGLVNYRSYYVAARDAVESNPRFSWSPDGGQSLYYSLIGPGPVSPGGWHHFAAVRSGPSMLMYVDGVAVTSTTAPTGPIFNSTEPLRLGNGFLYDTEVFAIGLLDEVRVWNIARSRSEIQANRFWLTLPQAGLVGYWTFNEVSGDALDSSGSGNHGTIQGDAARVPCSYP